MTGFLAGVLLSLLHWLLFVAGRLGTLLLWLFWPVWLLALTLGWLFTSAKSAQAGWFSWLWGDSDHATQQAIQRLESANRVLHSAAEVVNESSRQQAEQNVQVLSAIQTLSNERTELAGYLERVSQVAAQDSQLAAAISLAAPVLLAVSVLLVAVFALWITHKSQPDDAGVLDVLLVEELTQAGRQGSHGFIEIGPLGGSASPRLPSPPSGPTTTLTPRRLPGRVKNIYDHHDQTQQEV